MTSARWRGHRSRSRDAARQTMTTSVSTVDHNVDGDCSSAVEATNCSWSTLSVTSERLQRIRRYADDLSALDAEAWSSTVVGVATSTAGCPTLPPAVPLTPQLNRLARHRTFPTVDALAYRVEILVLARYRPMMTFESLDLEKVHFLV